MLENAQQCLSLPFDSFMPTFPYFQKLFRNFNQINHLHHIRSTLKSHPKT